MNPPASTGPPIWHIPPPVVACPLQRFSFQKRSDDLGPVFRGFADYDNDPEKLETVFEELLRLLS